MQIFLIVIFNSLSFTFEHCFRCILHDVSNVIEIRSHKLFFDSYDLGPFPKPRTVLYDPMPYFPTETKEKH